MSGGFISLPVPRTRLPYIVYRAQICHNNTLQVFSSSNGSLSYRVENYNLWVDCDNLPAAAPDHKDPLQPLGQHLQELKVGAVLVGACRLGRARQIQDN